MGGSDWNSSDSATFVWWSEKACAEGCGVVWMMDEFVVVMGTGSGPEVIDSDAFDTFEKLVDVCTVWIWGGGGGDGGGCDDC